MQTINITGRVGANAETRDAGSGKVTNFNCAVDQFNNGVKSTNWFRVAIWGQRGEKLAQYITKGEKVAVSGELIVGEFNGKTQLEVRANDVDCFMSSKGGQQATPQREPATADLDDSVPF